MRLIQLCFVSLGAIPGSLLRWQLGDNFTVNLIGSLMIGFIYAVPCKLRFRLIFGLGFCGSLTSFSSWIFNCLTLIIAGLSVQAFLLFISMILIGILSVSIGYIAGKLLFR